MFVVQVIVQQVSAYVLATVISVLVQAQAIAVQQMLLYVLATVISVLVQVQYITVQQMLLYVLEIVISVLVLVQYITAQQVLAYVQATVIFVLVQKRHIIVQQVMLSVLTLLHRVPVQAVAQCLIVRHVLLVRYARAIVVVSAKPRIGGKICIHVLVTTRAVTLVYAKPVVALGICREHITTPKIILEVFVQEVRMETPVVGVSVPQAHHATLFAHLTGAAYPEIGTGMHSTICAMKSVVRRV